MISRFDTVRSQEEQIYYLEQLIKSMGAMIVNQTHDDGTPRKGAALGSITLSRLKSALQRVEYDLLRFKRIHGYWPPS